MLALVVVVAVLGLGSWTLLADGGPGAVEPRAAPANDSERPPAMPPFRYADAHQRVLFRIGHVSNRPLAAASTGEDDVPILVSRHAALAAARSGSLDVQLPDGTRYPVRHERSESAPGGTWTFVGRVDTAVGNLAAVITFGRDGVFGLLPTPDGRMLEITTRAGQAYLRPAGGLVPPGTADPSRHPDFLVPPVPAPTGGAGAQASATAPVATIGQAASAADGEVSIDVLATYTTNLVALRGSANAARAEFQNLVAVANQAHIDSGSRVRLQIADFAEIDYPAEAGNREVLDAITDGVLPDGTDLRALRDAAAADLVAVIRPWADGDPSCGIAWLPGSQLMAYALDDANGYSVTAVEDCGPLVLAHEIGHNLGLMHDRDTVRQQAGGSLQYGVFPFSFGYRQDGPPAFATVMAYEVGAQVWINRFSHPGTALCEAVACGIAGQSDNVRSLNLAADSIARFRDPPHTLSILDARVLEGNDDARMLQFTIRAASPAPSGGVTFDLAIAGGTATSGVDWQPAPTYVGTPTGLQAGLTTVTYSLEIMPDTLEEGDETILVRLDNVEGMPVHDAEAVGVIQDDDPRVPVRGRLRFPGGIAPPAIADIEMSARTQGLGLQDGTVGVEVRGAEYLFEAMVPKDGNLELSASLPDPFFVVTGRMIGITEAIAAADLPVQVGVRLSGELKYPAGAEVSDLPPVILWNPRGDGYGYYVNHGDWSWSPRYDMLVMTHVPMQLEARDPPAPYVRQLVELPPLRGDGTWDIEMRDVPSLTIAHTAVTEDTSANRFNLVTMTAELSMPAPPGGVTFDIVARGTADHDDFAVTARTFQIAEGQTTVPITVVVFGDDVGEPDEMIELHVTGIQGDAWSPGPGSVRIVTDEPGEVGEGTCVGSTEWPSVRMCH